jgi:hypothetical protein
MCYGIIYNLNHIVNPLNLLVKLLSIDLVFDVILVLLCLQSLLYFLFQLLGRRIQLDTEGVTELV